MTACLRRVFFRCFATEKAIKPTEISDRAKYAIERFKAHRENLPHIPLFINVLMRTGDDKAKVEHHISRGLQILHKKTGQNASELFSKALGMISPVFKLGRYKRGAKLIRVPLPLNDKLSNRIAFGWLKDAIRVRGSHVPLEERFAKEVLSILEGTSPILSKKANLHKEAVTNRTFAPMRWPIFEPK